ncbi:MAG: alpha-hydroxy-acid oxidizing enzyme [Methylotenera sp.]|uniref:alpha-hydroxy acid oxidase n=1 Tax=Methylotenera sp. TaxID=2051956 RepID=UPI000D423271|nr:alpha-hydroxy acid oxidase [Methylotenera sp.]PPC84083.1 MAG: alpha-hydroxy-acid oxidizing enzyme [Methylotenera sp.]
MAQPSLSAIPPDIVCAADYERYAPFYIESSAWAYLQGGAADELTLAANSSAWAASTLLPRVLSDVAHGHTRCDFFGDTFAHPVILAPVATQRLFHPEGEIATVLAAGVMGGAAVISTQASIRLEDVAQQAHGPLWFQLYWQGSRTVTLELVKRAEIAGYKALVFTVDAPVSGVRNREQRAGFSVPAGAAQVNMEVPNLPELQQGMSQVFDGLMPLAPRWHDIEWLVKQTNLPIIIKGILHPADAKLAVEAGAAGVVVSNHGGRVLDSVLPTFDALPGVVSAVNGVVPVLVDGGIRRGTDIVKAIALGASAVMIGRPYIHALATAGALGVAHLIRLLREELEITMALAGCKTLSDINMELIYSRQR